LASGRNKETNRSWFFFLGVSTEEMRTGNGSFVKKSRAVAEDIGKEEKDT
jgi:hypothetical protein